MTTPNWEKEFDEKFEVIYHSNNEGTERAISYKFPSIEDYKSFLSNALIEATETQRRELFAMYKNIEGGVARAILEKTTTEARQKERERVIGECIAALPVDMETDAFEVKMPGWNNYQKVAVSRLQVLKDQ